MGKKFKITEDQLKRLVENKDKFQEQHVKVEETVETTEEETVDLPEEEEETNENKINEAVEKIKSQFKRFM
jgi:uncharacterized protein YlxW (UPF0749 family)